MRRDGWPALCIHGDKEQHERNWVLNGKRFLQLLLPHCLLEFKTGKVPILLATDVAARGLGKFLEEQRSCIVERKEEELRGDI